MTSKTYRYIAISAILLTLACGVAVPVQNDNQLSFGKAGVIPPTHTATVAPVPNITAIPQITIIAVTELNIRECGGMACQSLHTVAAGTPLIAFCNGEWCYSTDERGWFCYAAAVGAGGCEAK